MLSVSAAQELIAAELGEARRLLPRLVPLGESLGCQLAEDMLSDIDSPPHDKSMVDGYAVVAEGLASGDKLSVLEEVTAGTVPTKEVKPGSATRIMTGAPLPAGSTAVVMVEKTESPAGDEKQIRILETPRPSQNIVRKGTSLRRGETVLRAGEWVRPATIGLLAEVGRSQVKVASPVTVAILATGNEIVPVEAVPAPGQIRNSNGPMLEALVRQRGAMAVPLGVARDERSELAALIRRGLESNLLILSGGVSAGVLDLVPGVLAEMGVRQVFHKVDLKPGKPVWFGIFEQSSGSKCLVFGLPGNPVSTFVCFELFVRFVLNRLRSEDRSTAISAQLTGDHQQRGGRPTYWPAVHREAASGPVVSLLPWKGSGDLKTLAEANCLAVFPGEERLFRTGDEVDVHLL